MNDFDTLAAALRASAASDDGHRRAALELLITQGQYYLRDELFAEKVVRTGSGRAWISWDAVEDFTFAPDYVGSTTELAMLRFAVALAKDHFNFNHLSDGQAEAVTRAVQAALGTEEIHG